jgi:hypothetical protein
MGHKGHMFLASSVITQAKEAGADPYFVVSKTVGKDDPINPDEKLAIYKKVFPQSGHIFQTATDEMPDLTRVLTKLNQMGYTDATVVVGADQVNALGYVKNYNGKPDKSGNIPFSFNSLNVISRQETNDPSRDQEGPRATPMRQVLMDPSKSEQEQFAVWRDAMSPELSDDEVRDLMTKAKERMTAMSAPKVKKATAKEDAAGVGVIASKKQAKDPRYSTSLTVDVRPGQVKKNLKAFNLAELSNDTLAKYKTAAAADAKKADAEGDFKRGNKRFSGIVKATNKQFANDTKRAEEGIGSKLAGLGLAGAMALGAGGANARVVPGQDDPGINRLTGKPNVTQVAPSDAKPAVAEPTGFSKEWLQKAADPNRTGRYMISVEKAQELLNKMNAVDEAKKKGADGKACWDGYRYNGTENGKDKCVKVSEDVEDIMDNLINKIIMNEAIQNNRR